jgi:predicted nucleotidyltransferase
VDLLPFSRALAPNGRLELSPGVTLNVAGFEALVPSAIVVSITPDLTVPVARLPLYVLLKIVAYADRREPKDLASVLHCLRHYREDDDARYGLEHEGDLVPFEFTSACLLGLDAAHFVASVASVASSIRPVLDLFDGPDAPVVGLVAYEDCGVLTEDGDRDVVFGLFRWFRLAAGV